LTRKNSVRNFREFFVGLAACLNQKRHAEREVRSGRLFVEHNKVVIVYAALDRALAGVLQALIDQCYHNGRYDDIDYSQEPDPQLEPEGAAWADKLLKAAGKR